MLQSDSCRLTLVRLAGIVSPSQWCFENRLNLWGHLYRHPGSLETQATFMPSAAYRHTRGPNMVGRPTAHWAESYLVEASQRIDDLRSDAPPVPSHIDHEFFSIPGATEIRRIHPSHPLVWMENTPLYQKVSNVAKNRTFWT